MDEICQEVWHLQPISSHTLYSKMSVAQICQGDLDEKRHKVMSYLLIFRTSMCQTFTTQGGKGEHPGTYKHIVPLGLHSSNQCQVLALCQFLGVQNIKGDKSAFTYLIFQPNINCSLKMKRRISQKRRFVNLSEPENTIILLT